MAAHHLQPYDLDLGERLDRYGYAVVENFITPAEIAHLLKVFQSLECPEHHGAWSASMYSSDLAYRAAVDRAIKEILRPHAAPVLPGHRLFFCNFLVKEPQRGDGDLGAVQIHQDPTFVDEKQFDTVGIWIPLVDTDVTNGAISVLPGSHRWNDGPRGYGGCPTPYFDLLPSFLKQAQYLPMKAGTALVFSQKVFHGSLPNRGRTTRVAVTGLLAAKEAPVRCYHSNPALPGKLEVFEVDDLFYTRHGYGTRPEGVPCIGVVDRWHDPITPEQLAASRDSEHVMS